MTEEMAEEKTVEEKARAHAKDFRISETEVLNQAVSQPEELNYACSIAAARKGDMERAAAYMDYLEAFIKETERKNAVLDAMGKRKAPSETQLLDRVRIDERYMRARAEWIERRRIYEVAKGDIKALEAKTEMIKTISYQRGIEAKVLGG